MPISVRLSLRLTATPEANVGWVFAILGFSLALLAATVVHDNTKHGAWLAMGCGSLIGMFALYFPVHAWFVGGKKIQLLQNGTVTQAKFHSVTLSERRDINTPIVDFEYQVDGKAYTASTYLSGATRLTVTTCNAVFYDPLQPEQAAVLPCGTDFDEQTGRFGVCSLRWIGPLLRAIVVCGEVIAILVLVIHAIGMA
ncbi:MAG: hypothetical protein FWH27_18880 [Planctomycetaceae bacterium]|nr:hypothetical protein [Planctomycetaceae bacterium]